CQPEPYRAAPVLYHHGKGTRVQLIEKTLDRQTYLPGLEGIVRWGGRETESRVVRSNTSISGPKVVDNVMVKQRPRGITVHENQGMDGITRAFIDVMQVTAVRQVNEMVLEWVKILIYGKSSA